MAVERLHQTEMMLAALERGVNNAEGRLDHAARQLAREMVRPDGIPFAKMVGLVSTLAGCAGLYTGYWFFGRDLVTYAELGNAVMKSWGALPPGCKAKIESEF